MAHFLKSYFLLFVCFNTFGQVKRPEIVDASLEKLYLGFLGKQIVKTDTAQIYNNSTLRFGALVSRNFTNQLKIRSLVLFKFETKEPIKSIGTFELIYQPNRLSRLQFGYVGTAFSELRPNPLTPESQTEFITQSKVPGAKPNLKYFRHLNQTTSFSTSVSFYNDLLGYQLKFIHRKIVMGLQLEKYNSIVAIDLQYKKLRGISVYNFSKKEFNQTLLYSLKEYQFYLENAINSSQLTQDFEIGVRNNFSITKYNLKGFIGVTYNNSENSILGSLFIHFYE